jgi:phenylacetate-CoA ligase
VDEIGGNAVNVSTQVSRLVGHEWISELVEAARARVPFYRDHLAGADARNLDALPTFNKATLARYGRFAMSARGAEGAFRVVATSGTTGDRLFLSFDEGEWQRTGTWLTATARRVGVTSDDVLLNTHCYGLWVGGPALDLLAHGIGAGLVPLGPIAPATVLQLLAEGVGTAISATPSYMRRLIEAAQANDFDLRRTRLRFGFIGAEAAEEPLRRKLLSRLPEGFRWIELYGLSETTGPSIARAPDPSVPELELNTHDYCFEVLHLQEDRPVAMGQVGELTITTRRIDGRTPLVRYRTRDLFRALAGTADAPTRISRHLGRVDDTLKIGGVQVYSSAIAEIMSASLPATSEWRAEVHSRGLDDELWIEVEAAPEVCKGLERSFRERIGVNLSVRPVGAHDLVRSREKSKRILVESPAAAAARRAVTVTG